MSSPVPTTSAVLPVEAIRRRFPALRRRHGQEPVAYFDGPGGTQVPQEVVDAMADYLVHHNANTHWHFPTSLETDAALSAARRAVADFLNASASEVAFGNNMTSLTFHVSRALGRGWGPGDEIVVTELDHHANVAPWRVLVQERGVTVRTARMIPETGQLDWVDLERAVTGRTRLLAIGAASNALGTVNDIPRAARLVHDAGGLLFVDAVHYAAHLPVDVRAFECDFLVCSAYKFYGPHVGVLYGRQELLGAIDVPKLQPAPDTVPERLETGTQNHEGIVGTAAAIEFLAGLASGAASRRSAIVAALGELHARGQALVTRLHQGLSAVPGVTVYGPQPDTPRTPTISFTVADRASDEVARELASRALFLSNGNFYAATVAERLGHRDDGLVRAGCACYTTGEEVERLVAAVEEIAR
jgi:cysteine desulfurase family protein (TIGR01976 family)